MKQETNTLNSSRRGVIKGLVLIVAGLFATKLFGAIKIASDLLSSSKIKNSIMENPVLTPLQVINKFLSNTTNPDVMRPIITDDATYISLNFSDPELKRILPWAGTHKGAQSFIDTFAGVNEFWTIQAFEVQDIFSEGEKVAVFGSFTYTSRTLNKKVTSPFSILAKVKDGKIYHFMFMEDTFATAGTFRITPAGKFHSNPKEKAFELK
jgi:ketosteroid isomerase-like protein